MSKSNVEQVFGERIEAKAAQVLGEPPTFDFTSLITDLLTSLLEGCLAPSPEELAKSLNKPTRFQQSVIKRRARKEAVGRGMTRKQGEQAAEILLTVGTEATPEDCRALVEYSRDVLPNFDMI